MTTNTSNGAVTKAPASLPTPTPSPALPALPAAPVVASIAPALVGSLAGAVRYVYDEPIAALTAWIGPNGSGKTSRLLGVELAVEHKRPGHGKAEDLTPPGHEYTSSVLDLWGTRYRFDSRIEQQPGPESLAAGAVPVSSSVGVTPVALVRPASWLVSLGKAGARAEVVRRWAGGAVDVLATPPVLSTAQAALWLEGIAGVRKEYEDAKAKARKRGSIWDGSDDDASVLADLISWARRRKLQHGKVRDSLSSTLETARASLPATTGAEDEGRLSSMLAEAEAWERTTGARATAEALNRDAEAYGARVAQFAAATAPLPRELYFEAVSRFTAERAALLDRHAESFALGRAVERSTVHCPVCAQAYDQATARAALAVSADGLAEGLRSLDASLEEANRALAAVDQYRASWSTERDAIERERDRITQAGTHVQAALAGAPAQYSGPASVELRARVEAARNAGAARLALTAQAEAIDIERVRWKDAQAVEVAAGQVLATLTATVGAEMQAAIARAMPGRYRSRFAFDFDTGQFVITGEDGRPHGKFDFGGGEGAALDLALARAWAGGRPYVLLLEFERDLASFDADTRAAVLTSLAEEAASGRCVVLLASPEELPLDGRWLVHRTSGVRETGTVVMNVAAGTPVPTVGLLVDGSALVLPTVLTPPGTVPDMVAPQDGVADPFAIGPSLMDGFHTLRAMNDSVEIATGGDATVSLRVTAGEEWRLCIEGQATAQEEWRQLAPSAAPTIIPGESAWVVPCVHFPAVRARLVSLEGPPVRVRLRRVEKEDGTAEVPPAAPQTDAVSAPTSPQPEAKPRRSRARDVSVDAPAPRTREALDELPPWRDGRMEPPTAPATPPRRSPRERPAKRTMLTHLGRPRGGKR